MVRESVPAAAAKLLQSCLTLCDPIDGSPLGSFVPGILQARILEWVAISFSNAWKWKVKVKSLSHAQLLSNPWSAAYQAPPSMGFSRQEYWSGVPLPSLNQFLGSLIRSPGFLRRRKGSGVLEKVKGVWGSQREKDKLSFLHCFVLVDIMMYLAWGLVSP